jgi:hypothetical protein
MSFHLALYPLLSCFLSITVCILSVYTGMHQNPTDFVSRFKLIAHFSCPDLFPQHINLRIFSTPTRLYTLQH